MITTRERLIQEIEKMTEKQREQFLDYASLVTHEVKIERFDNRTPVIKETELSKLDLQGYFNDNWNEEEK